MGVKGSQSLRKGMILMVRGWIVSESVDNGRNGLKWIR